MRDLAAAADRIDNWFRRPVIVSSCGTHPSQSKLSSARHRRVGLSAIGQCLKAQYDALAAPIPSHLAALLKQLETQERG
jgi:Anti-sigma factor NepR